MADTQVLFCTTLTRTRDYNRFATETGVKLVEKLGAGEKRDENLFPASTLSWNNAKAFCDWLSKKEGQIYRLPTDREWSIAVGIGSKEAKDAVPGDLDGKLTDTYPWGTQWPPPDGVGNYSDESFKAFCKKIKFQGPVNIIKGYRDGEIAIAPVEAMKPNGLGLYDLGGNLRQWCEDWYDAAQTKKLLRGSSWGDADPDKLLSSKRWPTDPAYEENNRNSNGFRCVLELPRP